MGVHDDDTRRLACRVRRVESVDERLTASEREADLLAVTQEVDQLEAVGAATFAVVGKTIDGPVAVAFIDGAQATKAFVERFNRTGTPTIWPCKTVIGITIFGLDGTNPETVRKIVGVPRGRWLVAASPSSDELIDPTGQRPGRPR